MANAADKVSTQLYGGADDPTDLEKSLFHLVLKVLSSGYSGGDSFTNPAREVQRRLALINPKPSPAVFYINSQLAGLADKLDPRA